MTAPAAPPELTHAPLVGGRLAAFAGRLAVALMLAALGWVVVAAAWRGDYPVAALAAGALALGLVPAWCRRCRGVPVPRALEFLIVLHLWLHTYWGVWHRYYDRYWFWDRVLHFHGAALVTFVAFLGLASLRAPGRPWPQAGLAAALAVAVGNALGAWWEIGEYCVDQLLGKNTQYGLDNTMWDLINNLLGSLAAAGLGLWLARRGRPAEAPTAARSGGRSAPAAARPARPQAASAGTGTSFASD